MNKGFWMFHLVSIQQGKELTIICLHYNNGLQLICVYLLLIPAMYV